MGKRVRKTWIYVLLGVAVIIAASFTTQLTGESLKIKGVQITDVGHCGEAFGFPFIYLGEGQLLEGVEGGFFTVADCFPTVDNTSFLLNMLFYLMSILILIFFVVQVKKKLQRSKVPAK